MGDVVFLKGEGLLDRSSEMILEEAKAAGLTSVLVMGYRKDDTQYNDHNMKASDILWVLEAAKARMMDVVVRLSMDPGDE